MATDYTQKPADISAESLDDFIGFVRSSFSDENYRRHLCMKTQPDQADNLMTTAANFALKTGIGESPKILPAQPDLGLPGIAVYGGKDSARSRK